MKNFLKQTMVIFFLIQLVCYPQVCIQGAKDGLSLWYQTLLPTLFPFILISGMLSTDSVFGYLVAFFCGYPLAAKLADKACWEGILSKKQAVLLICIANNASILFLTGYVHRVLIRNALSLPRFLFCFYFPILLFGCCSIPLAIRNKKNCPVIHSSESTCHTYHSHMIEDAVWIITKIGVYVMLCTIISALLRYQFPDKPILPVLLGLLEISSGLPAIQVSSLPENIKTALIISMSVFGGCCCILQTKSVLKQSGLSIIPYITVKAFLALTSFFITMIILSLP